MGKHSINIAHRVRPQRVPRLNVSRVAKQHELALSDELQVIQSGHSARLNMIEFTGSLSGKNPQIRYVFLIYT